MGKLVKKIGKDVKVRKMRFSSIDEVRKIKEARPEKSYKAIVACKEGFAKDDLTKLSRLQTLIFQRTPQRVLHRRPDLKRKRNVKAISGRIQKGRLLLTIRGDAGLYIKELISGDLGRTQPSLSSILGKQCECIELDVIAIHVKK